MLAIEREPLYKNRLLLSAIAVTLGFILTVAIIRAVLPADSTQQSAQTNTDRRSSSLIPVSASESESSSESDSKTDNATSTESAAVPGSLSPTSSPTTAQSAGGQTSSWKTPTASGTGTSSTSSQPSGTTSQPAPTSTTPTSSDSGQTSDGEGSTGGIIPCVPILNVISC